MSKTLYVYTITPHHLDLIDGLAGKVKLARLLGIKDAREIAVSAWNLDHYGEGKLQSVLTETYGIDADALTLHALTIEAAKNYVVCITSDDAESGALKMPPATTGLDLLFSHPLPKDKMSDPDRALKKREARMGGMVATAALVVMFAFMGLIIWIGS